MEFFHLQGLSVISSLLKAVMKAHDLQQVGLADVMEVSVDRVKSLTSGKVKNLKREESELLIGKLGIRAEWLVTGEGPMHEDGESQDEFVSRMQAIKRMAALIQAMPVRELTKMRLSALMTGDPAQDGPLIAQVLSSEAQGTDFATGEHKPPKAEPELVLSAEEKLLLEYFREASKEVKRAALGALLGAAQASHIGGDHSQHSSGTGAIQIGSIGSAPARRRRQ